MSALEPAPTLSAHTPLAVATWLSRHQVVSVALVALITVVVGYSAAIGHSGAELIAYVVPLLVAGVIATRPALREIVREFAVVFGLLTAAALVAEFAAGSIVAPAGYFLTLCLASLYERRRTLVFAFVMLLAHEIAFGTVVPDGEAIHGIPEWATTALFGLSFAIATAILTIPWRGNVDGQRLLRRQRSLIADQLAVSEIVVGVDTLGRVTLISDHGLMVLGLEREALVGADFLEAVVAPKAREAARAGHERLIAAGKALAPPAFYEFEHAIVTGSGERRIFLWRVTVSCVGDEVVGTVASGFDITEVRRAQTQLQRDQRDLGHLRQLAQAVARETDARESVVLGIQTLVDADVAGMFEPSPSGDELVLTRCTNVHWLGTRVAIGSAMSGVAISYVNAEPFFVGQALGHPLINQELARVSEISALLYQPIIYDGAPAGVLVVGWSEPLTELDGRRGDLVALAAEEAASALQRLAAMHRWEEAALTDVLTGIPNRRAFDRLIEDAVRRAEADHQPLALALMDLNGFKVLNDTEGHAAGDRVLKESASLWHAELRPTDVLARLGGDEFAVLLPNCGAAFTDAVAGRLRGALRHEAGCGVGIAVWDGEESISTFMQRADEALYADKADRSMARLADPARVAAVEATGFVRSGTDARLDELAETVTTLLGVPVSMISLLDDADQHFAGRCGMGTFGIEDPSIPWSVSFCRHPVATGRPLIIDDVREHPLVKDVDQPVAEGTSAGAYAGIPIVDDDGRVLGTTCAVDIKPRAWTADEIATLRSVAARATEIILRGVRQD